VYGIHERWALEKMITVRQLEILAAVLEHGSFRRCGQKLNISPVSVSEHMRAFETQLGVELFVRSPGGAVTPTAAGARAFDSVHELLAHVHDFVSFVVDDTARQQPIRIAMHGFMMRNLASAVAAFDAVHDRRLMFISDDGAPEDLHRRVIAGELDAAYFFSVEGAYSLGQVVGHEPLAIYVGEDHPLAGADHVTADQLNATPLIGLAPDKPLRHMVDEALRRYGVNPSPHVVETSEFGLILSSLHRNLGFTCMFESVKGEEKQASGLAIVRCETPLRPLEIRRITRRTVLRFQDVREALRLAEQTFTQL
jgi:DNA-binding transcriptional LysR family regulator